jgi:hypothetical protein
MWLWLLPFFTAGQLVSNLTQEVGAILSANFYGVKSLLL